MCSWCRIRGIPTVRREDIERCSKLKILASSEQAGVYAMATEGGRQIFITGHSEYDARTLEAEYLRDKNAGLAHPGAGELLPGQ